jgi:hypothetical protein
LACCDKTLVLGDDEPGGRPAQELGPDRDDVHVFGVDEKKFGPFAPQKGDQAGKRSERTRGLERDHANPHRNGVQQLAATAVDEKRHLQPSRQKHRGKADVQPLRPAAR